MSKKKSKAKSNKKLSESPINLVREIKGSIKQLKENGSTSTQKIYGLEKLLLLIKLLSSAYSSSSKKVSLDRTGKALGFLYLTLKDEVEENSIDKLDKTTYDKFYLKEFLDFIFNENSWEEWDYYELMETFSSLMLHFLPKNIFNKIKLPINLLKKINMELMQQWAYQQSYVIKMKLERYYKLTEYQRDFDLFLRISRSLKNEILIKSNTEKEKKIFTYDRLNEILKRETEFWDIFTNRENLKLTPNKKYTKEMFEFTSQQKLEGYKDYVAYRKTLTKFELNPLKDESYGKQYRSYLKKKK